MTTLYLVNAASFYVRRGRRLKRAGLDPLNYLVEAVVWDYARRAAGRLERLHDQVGCQLEPVPAPDKLRHNEIPDD